MGGSRAQTDRVITQSRREEVRGWCCNASHGVGMSFDVVGNLKRFKGIYSWSDWRSSRPLLGVEAALLIESETSVSFVRCAVNFYAMRFCAMNLDKCNLKYRKCLPLTTQKSNNQTPFYVISFMKVASSPYS